MRRTTPIMILLLFLPFLAIRPAAASWWPWGGNSLVTIDGTQYTTKDFKKWWGFYNDKNKPLPKTPEIYVDWLLLAREGDRMHLADDPGFKRQTKVFLKVRSLMLLQKEEVLDKIKITDQQIRARYEKRYLPLWKLARLEFVNEKVAKAAWKELKAGTVTVDQLEKRPQDKGGPLGHMDEWQRPVYINEQWAEIFRKLPVGGATKPYQADKQGHFSFFVVKERSDGSDKDFADGRKLIREDLFKEQQDALTKALIFKLRNKYDVKIDEKKLAALDIHKPEDTYSDTPIMTSNKGNLSEKQFMVLLNKDQAMRAEDPHSGKKTDDKTIKERVINGVVAQNVTDWEALARHYEKREPFASMYRFNIRHRLTNAVQARLIASLPKISKDEIKKYYSEHEARYTQPEMVDLVLIQDKKGDVDRVWTEVAAGTDFTKAVKELTDQSSKTEALPFPHLNPALRKVVGGLAKGETSRPFTVEGHRFLVHLTKRTPARPIPLAKVEENIRNTIQKERTAKMGKKYLDQLKSKSTIKIDESNWQEIQKELGGTSK